MLLVDFIISYLGRYFTTSTVIVYSQRSYKYRRYVTNEVKRLSKSFLMYRMNLLKKRCMTKNGTDLTANIGALGQALGQEGGVLLRLVHNEVEMAVQRLLTLLLQLLPHAPFKQLLRVGPEDAHLARHIAGNLAQVGLFGLLGARHRQLTVLEVLLHHGSTAFGIRLFYLDLFLNHLAKGIILIRYLPIDYEENNSR